MKLKTNNQANESINKFNLISSYGGPGSIIHTQYGSILVSSIEEWGFLQIVNELHNEAINEENLNNNIEIYKFVVKEARKSKNGNIKISNDIRFLNHFKKIKNLTQLKYFVLIPDIELNEYSNTVKNGNKRLTIPSVFMPNVFIDANNKYNTYNYWYKQFEGDDRYFFPPKSNGRILKQDNIVLICEHGHISSFPWSKYLNWRTIKNSEAFDTTKVEDCCPNNDIYITNSKYGGSGFEGKFLKCKNCNKSTSLTGLFNSKYKCSGHKPWEQNTGCRNSYYGSNNNNNISENCTKDMKVTLTTGNNLYYSRVISSIFIPSHLIDNTENRLNELQRDLAKYQNHKRDVNDDELKKTYEKIINETNRKISELKLIINSSEITEENNIDIKYKYQEFDVFNNKSEEDLNTNTKDLKIKDCKDTVENNEFLRKYFNRILRIDSMKITSAQLDFSRVHPYDGDQIGENSIRPLNIFRSLSHQVKSYPVIENYGEGIFFSFNTDTLNEYYNENNSFLNEWMKNLENIQGDDFSRNAITKAKENNYGLYIIHTFSHLLMRELEFRCGYPTSSLKERIYFSNNDYKMNGVLIYTTEGAEGSMGGLIAQTSGNNLENLIKSALLRATICNSDPLCWNSDGQGLFNLNFSSCFSCSLVSETSCEERNIFLDRKLLVCEENGLFKSILNN